MVSEFSPAHEVTQVIRMVRGELGTEGESVRSTEIQGASKLRSFWVQKIGIMSIRAFGEGALWMPLLVMTLLFFAERSSFATAILLLDFDDTVVETRESKKGLFVTPFRLFRINQRSTALQPEPSGPEEIWLTPQEYHRHSDNFGTGAAAHGNAISVQLTLASPHHPAKTKVRIGEYMIRDPDTFQFFNQASGPEKGKNFLLTDFKQAEAREAASGGTWKGPYWDLMVAWLSHPDTAKNLGIVSARGHSTAEWMEFFSYLKDRGYIKYLPKSDHLHSVSRFEYDRHVAPSTPYWDRVTRAKTSLVRMYVENLERTNIDPDTDLRRSVGYGRKAEGEPHLGHVLIFADDRQSTVISVLDQMRKMASSRQFDHVKMIVANAGLPSELRAYQGAPRSVVQRDQNLRPALPDEMLGELLETQWSPEQRIYLDPSKGCEGAISGPSEEQEGK